MDDQARAELYNVWRDGCLSEEPAAEVMARFLLADDVSVAYWREKLGIKPPEPKSTVLTDTRATYGPPRSLEERIAAAGVATT